MEPLYGDVRGTSGEETFQLKYTKITEVKAFEIEKEEKKRKKIKQESIKTTETENWKTVFEKEILG